MFRKKILPIALGLLLSGSSVVFGQQQQQPSGAQQQNQPRPATFQDRVKSLFGIGEPIPAQNQQNQQRSASQQANGQQQQHVHNHGPVNGGQQAQAATNHNHNSNQSAVAQRPSTNPANTASVANPGNNTANARTQNSAIAGNSNSGASRVPPVSRATTFSSSATETVRIASSAPPTEPEESTVNRLNRIRGSIFEKTAESREQMLKRKEATLVTKNDTSESSGSERVASSSSMGISSTRKTYVADVDGEAENGELNEEPTVKAPKVSGSPKIALPKNVPAPSERKSKMGVVETIVAPEKDSEKPREEKIAATSKRKPAVKERVEVIAEPEDDELEEIVMDEQEEQIVISTDTDDLDEEIEETAPETKESTKSKIAESPVRERLETTPRRVASRIVNAPTEKESVEEISAEVSSAETTKQNVISDAAILEVEMNGPKKRIIGQESPYQFTITNRGGAVAEQVVLAVELPIWAEIQSFDPKVGATSVEEKNPETNLVLWTIDRLEASESQQLVLHLIPRQRKTLTMSWDYNFKQPVAQMSVDVLEPKLDMSLEGPFEMMWGTEEEFRLRIQNTGNGDAEDIHLTLLASESEPGESETVPMGTLKAGQEKILTVSAFAKQQEKLEISVQATAPFGLQAEAKRTVKILRPKLTTIVEAPEMQFVGNQSEYRIVVQNTGTASAQNVEIKALIPSNAKYISHQGNGRVLPSLQNQVLWTVDTIPVGEEFACSVVCEMKKEGSCQVDVSATEKTGLNATAVAQTQVDAIADLALRIENPQGPIEVGKIAYHTITVTNRGSKPAENVEVIAAFADGVSPVGVEGGKATINENSLGETGGQVFFDKIPVVGPRQSIVLKIKAKSDVSGKQKIRVEMNCPATDTHLIHEESTHYYSKVKGETPTLRRAGQGTGVEGKRVAVNLPTLDSTETPKLSPAPTNLSPRPATVPISIPSAPPSKPVPTPAKAAPLAPAAPSFEPLAENFEDFVFEEFK